MKYGKRLCAILLAFFVLLCVPLEAEAVTIETAQTEITSFNFTISEARANAEKLYQYVASKSNSASRTDTYNNDRLLATIECIPSKNQLRFSASCGPSTTEFGSVFFDYDIYTLSIVGNIYFYYYKNGTTYFGAISSIKASEYDDKSVTPFNVTINILGIADSLITSDASGLLHIAMNHWGYLAYDADTTMMEIGIGTKLYADPLKTGERFTCKNVVYEVIDPFPFTYDGTIRHGTAKAVDCKNVWKIDIPELATPDQNHEREYFDVIELSPGLFKNKSKLEDVNIFTRRVDSIPKGCFVKCKKLHSVAIYYTAMTIKAGAFNNCKKLDWIYIPKGFKKVEKKAFKSCGTKDLVINTSKKKKRKVKKLLHQCGLKHYSLK